MTSTMEPWTLDEGLRLVRAIQPEIKRFGFHAALGGGVLNSGHSTNDLDIYLLSLEQDEDLDGLVGYLESVWGKSQEIGSYGGKRRLGMGGGLKQLKLGEYMAVFQGRAFPGVERPMVLRAEADVANAFDPDVAARAWVAKFEKISKEFEKAQAKADASSSYTMKLKFFRGTEEQADRIDVFILATKGTKA